MFAKGYSREVSRGPVTESKSAHFGCSMRGHYTLHVELATAITRLNQQRILVLHGGSRHRRLLVVVAASAAW